MTVKSRAGVERRLLRLGTRASRLALIQSEIVRDALLALRPDLHIRLEHITTKGDAVLDRPLNEVGGNGVFVTQIELALREGRVDLAVHSAKDLSSNLPPDMALAAFLKRADPRDVVLSSDRHTLVTLPPGARVGTSSPRRACQLLAVRPDLQIMDIRGNVDTRIRKLREGQYDAIVLAAAGLERLGIEDEAVEWLDPDVMLPATGQGALAVEVRADDRFMRELVGKLNDLDTAAAVRAERAFLASIGGSCSLPIGAYAVVDGDELHVRGMIGAADGRMVRGEVTGSTSEPEQTGETLAADLLALGGRELIEGSEGTAQ